MPSKAFQPGSLRFLNESAWRRGRAAEQRTSGHRLSIRGATSSVSLQFLLGGAVSETLSQMASHSLMSLKLKKLPL